MRLFIAIELSDDIQKENCRIADALGLRDYSGVRVMPAHNMHLTLKFIGDFDDGMVAGLCDSVGQAVAGLSTFEISLDSCGVFPPRGAVLVVWTGISDETMQLQRLASIIDKTCQLHGIAKEYRKFVPHLTLARVKKECSNSGELKTKAQIVNPEAITQTVTEITLFASELQNDGSIYTVIKKFPLNINS